MVSLYSLKTKKEVGSVEEGVSETFKQDRTQSERKK